MYRRRVIPWLIGPAVAFEILVYVLPIAAGIYTSTISVQASTVSDWLGAPFLGLGNFRLIVGTPAIFDPLLHSFFLSVEYTAAVVVLSLLLGFAAVVFVRTLLKGGRFFNVAYLLPFGIPAYAGALTWQFIFQAHGTANSLLAALHLPGATTLWMTGSNAFWGMVVATTWRTWPFVFLMLMAATQSISHEVVEALRVDGGRRWAEARYIVLPHVRPTLVTVSLILFFWTFNDFSTPYVFFGQIPPAAADLFPLHVYSNSFVNGSYSIGAAMTILAVSALLIAGIPYSRASGLLRGRGNA
jgi:multiple sugar transport system permease protein